LENAVVLRSKDRIDIVYVGASSADTNRALSDGRADVKGGSGPQRKRRILAVDDDAPFLSSLVWSLCHDAEVESAATVAAALDKLDGGGGYDAVMVDVEMPDDGGGLGLIERIRQRGLPLRIVLMSAQSENRARADELGLPFFDKAVDDVREVLADVWRRAT